MSQTASSPKNTKYISGSLGQYLIATNDDILNIDTSTGAITLYLPNILVQGMDLYPKRFYINDVGGFASVNPISIATLGGNVVNGGASTQIAYNNGSAEVLIAGNVEWILNQSNDPSINPVTGSGASPQLAVWSNTTVLKGYANLTGNTYGLGVGTAASALNPINALTGTSVTRNKISTSYYTNWSISNTALGSTGFYAQSTYGAGSGVQLYTYAGTNGGYYSGYYSPNNSALSSYGGDLWFLTGVNDALAHNLIFSTDINGVENWRIDSNGNLTNFRTTAQAQLMLKASDGSANSAPIMLTAGTLLSTKQIGAIEFDGAYLYYTNNSNVRIAIGTGFGSVTSVGLAMPSIFTVSNSPVTSSGTLTASLNNQSANLVFASPNSSSGTPSFRGLVAADIPALAYVSGSGTSGYLAGWNGTTSITNAGFQYNGNGIYIGANASTTSDAIYLTSNISSGFGQRIYNTNSSGLSRIYFENDVANYLQIGISGSGATFFSNSAWLTTSANSLGLGAGNLIPSWFFDSTGLRNTSSGFGQITLNSVSGVVGSAPIYLTNGSSGLLSQLTGAFEFYGNVLYFTPNGTREQIGLLASTANYNAGGVVYANGTAMNITSAGTAGQILTSNGSSAPTWSNMPSSGWSLTGNSGTTPGTNFIGTTDNVDLVFKINNIESGRLSTSSNQSFGYQSNGSRSTGSFNTAFGWSALYANSTGSSNSAFGYGALTLSSSSISSNNAFGYNTLYNSTGSYNNAFGSSALYTNTSGQKNNAFGTNALYANLGGNDNTALGYQAGFTVVNNSQNTLIGSGADVSSNVIANGTAIGYGAIASASNSVTLGNSSVTAIYLANSSATTLYGNSGAGTIFTINSTSNTSQVTGSGLQFKVGTQYSGGIGWGSNSSLGNTYLGYITPNLTTASLLNTGIGYSALQNITSSSARNVSIGALSGNALTSGTDNVFIGAQSAQSTLTTGTFNVLIGSGTGVSNAGQTTSIALGRGTTVTNNFLAQFGNSTYGYNFGLNNYAANAVLEINASPNLYYTLSSPKALWVKPGSNYIDNTTAAGTTSFATIARIGAATMDTNGNLITVTNAIGLYVDAPNSGTYTTFTNAYAIYANGSVKVTSNLSVAGQIQYTYGTPVSGYVLTSDASGNATWSAPAGSGWSLTGNSGTTAGTNFIGTTDNVDLQFKVNGTFSGCISKSQNSLYFGYNTGYVQNSNNVFIGNNIAPSFTSVSNQRNTFIGNGIGYINNVSGSENTAIGHNSMYNLSSGVDNSAIGRFSMYALTSGQFNSSIGYESQFNNTNGSNNTSIGSYSSVALNGGGYNTDLGVYANQYNVTGNYNTFIGANSGNSSYTSNSYTFVAGYGEYVTGSNLGNIGNGSGTLKLGINQRTPTAALHVTGTGTNTSTTTYGLRVESSNNVASMIIRDDGHIGINTTPQNPLLTIVGTDNTSSNYAFWAQSANGNTTLLCKNDNTVWIGSTSGGIGGNLNVTASTPSIAVNTTGSSTNGQIVFGGNGFNTYIGQASSGYSNIYGFSNSSYIANLSSIDIALKTAGGKIRLGYADTRTDVLTINTSNSFAGINQNAPSAAFHITGTTSATTSSTLRVENSSNTATLIINDGGYSAFGMVPGNDTKVQVQGGTSGSTYSSFRVYNSSSFETFNCMDNGGVGMLGVHAPSAGYLTIGAPQTLSGISINTATNGLSRVMNGSAEYGWVTSGYGSYGNLAPGASGAAYLDNTAGGTTMISSRGGNIILGSLTGTTNWISLATSTGITTMSGQFKYTNGSPALGKVLVSDASGNASWGTAQGTSINAYSTLGSAIKAMPIGLTAPMIGAGTTASSGYAYIVGVYLSTASTLTGVKYNCYQPASGSSSINYCGVALYSYSAGTLTLQAYSSSSVTWIANSGNQSLTFGGLNNYSSSAAPAGVYYIVFYMASTMGSGPFKFSSVSTAYQTGMSVLDFTNNSFTEARLNTFSGATPPTTVSSATTGYAATTNGIWATLY